MDGEIDRITPRWQEDTPNVSLGLCFVLREIAEESGDYRFAETLDTIDFSAQNVTETDLIEMLDAFYPGTADLAHEKLIKRERVAFQRERQRLRREKIRTIGGSIIGSFASLSTFGIPPYRRKS